MQSYDMPDQLPEKRHVGHGWIAGIVLILIFAGLINLSRHSMNDNLPAAQESANAEPTVPVAAPINNDLPARHTTGQQQANDLAARQATQHQARQAIQDYWNPILASLSLAYTAVGVGLQSARSGDEVAAFDRFSKAAQAASLAMDQADNNVPTGFDEQATSEQDSIRMELSLSANELKWASEDLVKYLDTPVPSMANDAMTLAANAKKRLDEATHYARVRYIALGGNWQDLKSLDQY